MLPLIRVSGGSYTTNTIRESAKLVRYVTDRSDRSQGNFQFAASAMLKPLGDVSIGDAIERYTGAKFSTPGTMTAALAITTAVKAVPVKQIGYSGLMLPVMEDKRLAQRWDENTYGIDALLAYSAVCGTGLDTVPLPGDVSEERLVQIYGDVAALAWKWKKPLSARLQPVKGKGGGDRPEFDSPYLFNVTLRPAD